MYSPILVPGNTGLRIRVKLRDGTTPSESSSPQGGADVVKDTTCCEARRVVALLTALFAPFARRCLPSSCRR